MSKPVRSLIVSTIIIFLGVVITGVSLIGQPQPNDLAIAAYRQGIDNRAKLAALERERPRSLTEAQRIAIERGLSPYRDWEQDHPNIEPLPIVIYPMMTAPDARQFADSLGVALRAGGFTVHVAQPSAWTGGSAWTGDPPDVTGLMLIAPAGDDPDENVPRLGAWIVAAFASAGITVVRREKPGWWQLCLLVGRKTDPS